MSATYFWYREKLVVIERRLTAQDFEQVSMHKYRYCPCVDGFAFGTALRYGIWVQNDQTRDWQASWESRPLDTFPAEFRAHLLLLGVS